MQKDYYSILNIDRESSQGDIKKAYKRLALVSFIQKYHPDKNSSQGTTAAFQNISEAYTSKCHIELNLPALRDGCEKDLNSQHPTNKAELFQILKDMELGNPAKSSIQEDPPPTLETFKEYSDRINSLFSEVIGSLEARIAMCEQMDQFPQMDEYMRKHVAYKSDVLVCNLCSEDVALDARWHFENVHYDEFLHWLDQLSKAEARKRRRKLVAHRREVKTRKTLKN